MPLIDLAVNPPMWLELATTGFGALEGAIIGRQHPKLDPITGPVSFAILIGFGGGIIRDILVGHLPPVAMQNASFLAAVLVGFAIAEVAGRKIGSHTNTLLVLDALVVGLFAIIGTQTAMAAGLPVLTSILIGTLAAVGGGIVASVLIGELPTVISPGPPYALAAVFGASVYAAMISFKIEGALAALIAITLTIIVRVVLYRRGVQVVIPFVPRPDTPPD